ncbi:hypothetical protein T05_14918 [Trichinella murrelli]|uniref:Uncharacterized protein n=1 Tax=Trichinella murrelli TaxID=144512 RepID=A0A0V0TCS9_9BILA|nr:hypothetical protein T05_14918 [Trichinella murrelli]
MATSTTSGIRTIRRFHCQLKSLFCVGGGVFCLNQQQFVHKRVHRNVPLFVFYWRLMWWFVHSYKVNIPSVETRNLISSSHMKHSLTLFTAFSN